MVEFFIRNSDIRGDLSEVYLKKVPDLSRIYKKFQTKRATLQDCYRIYQTLTILPKFKNCMNTNESEECGAIKRYFSDKLSVVCEELSKLEKSLDGVIDEERVEKNGEFWIKADYDDDLKELRNKLDEIEDKANEIYRQVDRELSRDLREQSAVKLEITAQGFAFRMTRKNEKCIRNNDKFFEVKHSTKKDGFRFQNKQIKKLSDEYIDARSQYERYQSELSHEIINDTGINKLSCQLPSIFIFFSKVFRSLQRIGSNINSFGCNGLFGRGLSNPVLPICSTKTS